MVGYRKIEALADRLAMRIGGRHGDWVAAEVAVGRRTRDDAGVGIDVEPGRQVGREAQRVGGGGGGEVTGDVEREGLAFIGALVCDGGCGRAAVADCEVEALADPVVHVDKNWIVCAGQAKLIVFDRKSLALKAVHDAGELLRASKESTSANATARPPLSFVGSPASAA